MALDVWFRSDLQNALRAAEQASAATLRATADEGDPYVAGFQAGHWAALTTMALAFGLSPSAEPVVSMQAARIQRREHLHLDRPVHDAAAATDVPRRAQRRGSEEV